MTVIAYKDGMLAADSGCYVGDLVPGSFTKLYRSKAGVLIGCAGTINDWLKFLAWFDRGGKGKRPRGDFEAIVVYPDGKAWLYDETIYPTRIRDKYYAIGVESGVATALGALHAGADAKSAVMAAVKHCTHAKGPVRVKQL